MKNDNFLTSQGFVQRFHYRTFFLYQVALRLDYIDKAEYYWRLLHGDYDFTIDDLEDYREFFSYSLENAKTALSEQEKTLYKVEIQLAEDFLLNFSFEKLKNEVVHKQHSRG